MSPADVVRSYLASFATGDPEQVAAHVTDGFVNEHTAALGSGCEGKAAYRERLPGFLASMPGLRYDVEDVIEDSRTDRVGPGSTDRIDDAPTGRAWAAYTLNATVNGRPVAVRGVMRFEVVGGLISRRVDYWDSLVFQRQAGLA